MSSDGEAKPLEGAVDAPKATRSWKRGNHMKRASQFPGIMKVRGDSMWNGVFHLSVTFVASASHKRAVLKKAKADGFIK